MVTLVKPVRRYFAFLKHQTVSIDCIHTGTWCSRHGTAMLASADFKLFFVLA